MKQAIFLLSCGVLAVMPVVLVVNKVYHDRVIGRMALLGMSFAAWTYLIEFVMGTRYNVLPQTAMIFASFAAFMLWHYIRFYWRIVKWQREGKSANDIQNTVQFNTFAEICDHRGSPDITVRLCRNADHEAANTGMAICAEKVCPLMQEKN